MQTATVKIKHGGSSVGYAVINTADFIASEHELFDDSAIQTVENPATQQSELLDSQIVEQPAMQVEKPTAPPELTQSRRLTKRKVEKP